MSTRADEPQEPLAARMLNEFVYCPRLFYYENVEGIFVHNADTRRGAAMHRHVDSGRGDLPPAGPMEPPGSTEPPAAGGSAESQLSNSKAQRPADAAPPRPEAPEVIHSRSVSLASDRLGVIAKMDLVEVRTGTEETLFAPVSVCPVDYKIGSPREGPDGPEIWDADKMQLGLQCLILRDNGYACTEGVIYYRGTKQRVKLAITPALETWIDAQIAAARRALVGPIPPPLVDSPKCARCSLVTVCLPDETRLLRDAPARPDDEDTFPEQGAFGFDREFGAVEESGPDPRSETSNLKSPLGNAGAPTRRLIAARDDTRPLYITTPGVSVGRKSELVQVKEKGEVIAEIRISDLNHLAVFGAATVSTSLLQTLCEKDIPVSYFSSGGFFLGLTRGHSLKNVFTRIAQFRAAADAGEALRMARLMVNGKIRNQRTLLMRNHAAAPAHAVARLRYAAQHALEAQNLGELLGIEGSAALVYFENLSGMIKLGTDVDEALVGDGAAVESSRRTAKAKTAAAESVKGEIAAGGQAPGGGSARPEEAEGVPGATGSDGATSPPAGSGLGSGSESGSPAVAGAGPEAKEGSAEETLPVVHVRKPPKRRGGDVPGQQFFSFDFTRRNRRPPKDAVNALLSLGYSLLAKDCTAAAHAVGLDPYIGFYHQPRFGRPALALDLMEEFRPLIADSVALTVINTGVIRPTDFVQAGDAVNLSIEGRKRFFHAYESRMNATIVHPVFDYQVSYRRALELQARLLAKALTGEIEQYVAFTTR